MTAPSSQRPPRPAVFLDRDGTLIEERDYLARVEQLALVPGAAAALRALHAAGFALVVVTNQSGIARGLFDEETLAAIHAELARQLAVEGVALDGIYVCPHHPNVGLPPYRSSCDCRKPRPGLIRRAIDELGLALEGSFVVGDSARDLEAGAALGIPGVLVRTGKGRDEERRLAAAGTPCQLVDDDLPQAARRMLAARGHFS